MDRVIIHVDMDAFFARIEKLDRPELRGEPVVVGGQSDRGVVSTACYRAREYGVESAMPMTRAKELCPDAHFLSVRGERYSEVSEELQEILNDFTPEVETVSLDEAFLDVSGVLHQYNSPAALGKDIKKTVKDRLKLTCSVGIGPNKMIAKLASDRCKPDGLLEVYEREKQDFLDGLSVRAISGVGEKTARQLSELGVETVDQLRQVDRRKLRKKLGIRGVILNRRARGEDPSPVKTESKAKSISNEKTFSRDLEEREILKKLLYSLTEKVGERLRAKELEAKTVELKLRRGDFTTLTRHYTGEKHTDVTENIWKAASTLFEGINIDQRGVRLLGVGVTNLQPAGSQEELFTVDREKNQQQLNELIDDLNREYGDETIVRGGAFFGKE